jgi:GDPmannose 4,6-dehydratase
VDALKGDASRARTILGWTPRVDFDGLVEMMVAADMELAMREKTLVEAGYACNGSSRMI